MKVKNLKIRNFKGARQVSVYDCDPTCNEVSGVNGAGKSSVLDAIVAALAGKRSIDPRPLTDGELKGEISLDLGDVIVTRRFNEDNATKGGTLKVEGAKGQKGLDGLFNEFSFDPLAFTRMKRVEQVDVLKNLAGAEFCADLSAMDLALKHGGEERTLLGREMKRFGTIPDVEKCEPIDTVAIMSEINAIASNNRTVDAIFAEEKRLKDNIDVIHQRAAVIREQLEALAKQKQSFEDELAAQDLPGSKIDDSDLHAQLEDASRINANHQAYEQAEKQRQEKRIIERKYNDLSSSIEQLRTDKEKLTRSATLPVDGLSWDKGTVSLNEIPFAQLSSSERLRLAAKIGMAISPTLKVMLVHDGSLLDDNAFSELLELAKVEDYQLWIETVGAGHGDAMIIEEGVLDTDDKGEL